jgi:hypothetical protein
VHRASQLIVNTIQQDLELALHRAVDEEVEQVDHPQQASSTPPQEEAEPEDGIWPLGKVKLDTVAPDSRSMTRPCPSMWHMKLNDPSPDASVTWMDASDLVIEPPDRRRV